MIVIGGIPTSKSFTHCNPYSTYNARPFAYMYLSSGKFCRLLGRSLHVLVHPWITEHRCHQPPATQDPSHGVPLSTYRYSQHRPGVGYLLEFMLRRYFQCRPRIPVLMLYVYLQSSCKLKLLTLCNTGTWIASKTARDSNFQSVDW